MFLRKLAVPFALLVLLFFLLGLGWGMNIILENSAAVLLNSARQIETSLLAQNWSGANSAYQKTKKEWDEIRQYWPLLIHHQEMDRIVESLAKLKSYLRHEDSNNALAETYVLLSYIQHIPESKSLNLQNIF